MKNIIYFPCEEKIASSPKEFFEGNILINLFGEKEIITKRNNNNFETLSERKNIIYERNYNLVINKGIVLNLNLMMSTHYSNCLDDKIYFIKKGILNCLKNTN